MCRANTARPGSVQVAITNSSWIALRVRGSYTGEKGEIAAHTSAVQDVGCGQPVVQPAGRIRGLGADSKARLPMSTRSPPRPNAQRFREMRAVLEAAHNRLHQRMHAHGVYHQHSPVHGHEDDSGQ